MAAPSPEAIAAAELKATFGDTALLCLQADETTPGQQGRSCDDSCPLCQLHATGLALLLPPGPAELPLPPLADVLGEASFAQLPSPRRLRATLAQPRAPPFQA